MSIRTPQRPKRRTADVAGRHIAVTDGFPADRLGEELQSLFDRVATEPLPMRLTELADALERKYEDEAMGVVRRRPRLI